MQMFLFSFMNEKYTSYIQEKETIKGTQSRHDFPAFGMTELIDHPGSRCG